MTTDEVKRTVIEVVNLQDSIDKYVSMMEEEMVEDFVGDDFALIMHAVPYVLDETQVDTSLKDIRSVFVQADLSKLRCGPFYPDLHGIICLQSQDIERPYQFHLHRTGYVGHGTQNREVLEVKTTGFEW